MLAAIGAIESDHGRSTAPGVRSGVNAFGCCAGPMQFNLTNGPPSTWQTYRVDGDHDGDKDPYDPADAIASAGRYLRVLLDGARGDIARAVFGYNHSPAYVEDVLARARAYGEPVRGGADRAGERDCAAGADAPAGPANLQIAERRESPRAYAMLPAWAMAGGRPAQPIDARLLDNALWLLRTYRLRVTAAREGGHNTHGDGTALDLVPAEPVDQAAWDASAGALARDLGWTPACGASGTRPACPLVPAIQFVGYEGYRGHGSPRTCSGAMPRAPARLVGLAVLRHRRAVGAVRLGSRIRLVRMSDVLARPRARTPQREQGSATTDAHGNDRPAPSRRVSVIWGAIRPVERILSVAELP